MNETGFLSRIKNKLAKLAEYLAENNIKYEIKMEDIGISVDGEPKLFLRPTAEIIEYKTNKDKELFAEYQTQLDRLFDCGLNLRETIKSVSDYSWRLDKKLTEIEKRINKLRRKRKSHFLESSSSKTLEDCNTPSDESSNEKDKPKNKPRTENNIVLKHLTEKQNGGSKLTNSFVGPDSNRTKMKYHKSSFGDYSTTSHRLNEEAGKDATLKTRVSTALEKTQEAFKFYENYYKRRGRF